MYRYILTVIATTVSTGACSNRPPVLTGAQGEFGTDYAKDENCQWRIQVNRDKVNSFAFYPFDQNTGQCKKRRLHITIVRVIEGTRTNIAVLQWLS